MAMLLKFKLYIIIAVLLAAEGAVMFFVFGGKPEADPAEANMLQEAKEHTELVEFELGEYKISNNSMEGSPLRIDCKMVAEVPKEFETNFQTIYETKKHRVRDAVQSVIRGATYPDITDPDLGAIKRKLRKSITDVIGNDKPYISQIIVSDFQSYEL